MADLGKAYVQIVPTTKGISGMITEQLRGESQTAGDESGSTIGDSLVGKLKTVIAAAGLGKIISASLSAGADLQQSVGGIETIFKQSADTVKEYAKTAYSRAGVSANSYMEQVTSFSASLLQSLGNDTGKAAEYADRAMVDMSDNANKFGTDIESIQNAYQGFAKQNYTMLDNLKLGYGGTKEEMQRLISDASKMTDVQDELNVTVDDGDLSFGNIVNAISVMQKSLDISGTTSKEASTTFSGSFGAMKAAAEDFLASLTGVTDEAGNAILSISDTMTNLISTAFTFAFGNLIPMVANIAVNLPVALVQGLQQGIPQLVSQVQAMANSIPEGFENSIPQMVQAGLQALLQLSQTIRTSAGQLIQIGCDLLLKLATGFAQSIPTLIQYVPQIVSNIAGVINDNAGTILSTGLQIIVTLCQGLISAIPTLVANIPQIIQAIWDVFTAVNWLSLGSNIITFIGDGINALFSYLPELIKSIGETGVSFMKSIDWLDLGATVIMTIQNGISSLMDSVPNVLKTIGTNAWNWFKGIDWASAGRAVINFIASAIGGIGGQIWSALSTAGTNAMGSFKNMDWSSLGSNIINGIVGGIGSVAGTLYNKLKDVASNALQSAKDFLGINSPSKLFRDEVGKWIPAGISIGVQKDKTLAKAMDDMTSDTINRATLSLGELHTAIGLTAKATPYNGVSNTNNSTVFNQTINSAKALSPSEIAQETKNMMRRMAWA